MLITLEPRALTLATSLITCNASRQFQETSLPVSGRLSVSPMSSVLENRLRYSPAAFAIPKSGISPIPFMIPPATNHQIYFACVKLGQLAEVHFQNYAQPSSIFVVVQSSSSSGLGIFSFHSPNIFIPPEHEPILCRLCPSLITTIVVTNRPQLRFFFLSFVTHKNYHIGFRRFRIREEWYVRKPGWVRVWESSAQAA